MQISVIGIGAGDPEHLTVQALSALRRTDVVFVPDKGEAARDLVELRRQLCARFIGRQRYRVVEIPDPPRRRRDASYEGSVSRWHDARATTWARAIEEALPGEERGAFLAWGDPTIYDSTLRILDTIKARELPELEVDVVPGISAFQALTARHRIPLNRIAGAVLITTGRRLARGWPAGADDVVVMLDADCTFRRVCDDRTEIYWGAYLGTADEILIAGTVGTHGAQIEAVRSHAREARGWIFDTYLLRREPRQ